MNADKSIYMPCKNICELCIVYDDSDETKNELDVDI